MKRIATILVYLSIMLISCSPKAELVKHISYNKENVTFTPDVQRHEIAGGLTLTVKPIDAAALNEMTYYAATRGGDYEREYSRRNVSQGDLDNLNRSERRRIEKLIQKSEIINENVENGSMSGEMGDHLFRRIYEGSSHGFDGSENMWFRTEQRFSHQFNPFYVRGSYLSVFSLEFENNSNEVVTISASNFQVASGNEVIYPYEMAYFRDIFEDGSRVLDNALRYNMPGRLNITPGQKVEKFIAIPAISRHARDVVVQYIGDDRSSANFAYDVRYSREELNIPLTRYDIRSFQSFNPPLRYDAYYIAQFEDGFILPLESNSVYMSDERADQNVILCGLVDYNDIDFTFLRCLNIKPSNYSKSEIAFAFIAPSR